MLQSSDVIAETERLHGPSLSAFRALHEQGRALVRSAQVAAAEGDETHRLALSFLARATAALQATENLFAAGLETDALRIVRTLSGLAIDFRWIWDEDVAARSRLFIDYGYVLSRRRDQCARRVLGPTGEEIVNEDLFRVLSQTLPERIRTPEDFRRWREEAYERVKDRYPDKTRWAPQTLLERATEVGLQDVFEIATRLENERSHWNTGTMFGTIDEQGEGQPLVCDPKVPALSFTLVLAGVCFALVAESAAHYLRLDASGVREAADRLKSARETRSAPVRHASHPS